MRYAVVVFALAACNEPASRPAPVPPAIDVPDAPIIVPRAVAIPEEARTLLGEIERIGHFFPTVHDAWSACNDEAPGCDFVHALSYAPETHEWIAFDGDYSEGGLESIWVGRLTPTTERSILEGSWNDARRRALRTTIMEVPNHPSIADLVDGRGSAEFSLNTYSPLVTLAPPLEGWALHIESTQTDHAEYVMRLLKRDGSEMIELGRRPAQHGPCDGDGWGCEEDCTEEELREEVPVCVEPLGIGGVAISPDRESMFVDATIQVAGHGGYPPYRWVVALDDRVRAVMQPEAQR